MTFFQFNMILKYAARWDLFVIGTIMVLCFGQQGLAQEQPATFLPSRVKMIQDCSRYLNNTLHENNQLIYIVQPGDYLLVIARCFGVSAQDIARTNNIRNSDLILLRQRLIIPIIATPRVPLVSITPSISPSPVALANVIPPTPTAIVTLAPDVSPEVSPEVTDVPTVTPTSALQLTCPDVRSTPSPQATDQPFYSDTFDSDRVEPDESAWVLDADIVITDDQLQVTSLDDIRLATVPDVNLEQFSLEVDIRLFESNTSRTNAVIAFGTLNTPTEYNFVTFNNERIDIYEIQNGRERFISSSQSLVDFSCPQHVAIVYRNGQIEIYVNGGIQSLAQVSVKGDQLGLGVLHRSETNMSRVYFDNLMIEDIGSQ